ncbi:MAG: Rho termination factor N-terminal domain-containing protein, partial [Pseudooceanicola sp.]|nr:Rho termination factor N-terminal domain-containing protein [Pseudooceanicola sp.]
MTLEKLNLADLKAKSPADLLNMAEELEIENASTMRKGEMMFQILRERADEGWEVSGDGVLEVLQDGFGFLRSPEANYLPGPDDIYVSPDMIRQYSLRTGDSIEGVIRAPDDNERYFALVDVSRINFEDPERARHKIAFDNLTPLYPDERLTMEIPDPTIKDRTARIIDLVAPI